MFLKGADAERARNLISDTIAGAGNMTPLPALLPEVAIAQVTSASQTAGMASFASNWQGGAQVGLGSAGAVLGVLRSSTIGNIEKSLVLETRDFLDLDIGDDLTDGVKDFLGGSMSGSDLVNFGFKLGESLAEMGFQIASNVVNVVPIYGQIVSAIMKFGKAIYDLVQSSGGEHVRVYDRIGFNPEHDQIVYTQYCAKAAASGDWTSVFSPPVIIGDEWPLTTFVVQREDDGTDRIMPRGGVGAVAGGGFIPGTQHCLGFLDVLPNTTVRDTGDTLLPTLRQQGIWMWQGYTSPVDSSVIDPTIFSVDCASLLEKWSAYILQFRMFMEWKGGDKTQSLGDSQRKKPVIDYYSTKEFFGWPKGFIATGHARNGEPYVPTSWVGKTQPALALKALRAQQMAALDTLMCAYVDMRHAAVRGDPEVQARWRQRREQLIHSPDRFYLDLESIPPDPWSHDAESGAYFDKLIASGAGTKKGPRGPTIGLATTIPSGLDVVKPDVGPGLIAEGRRIKSPMLVALGIAAVGAGGYYVYRRRRR
jgi:hypothetical protein